MTEPVSTTASSSLTRWIVGAISGVFVVSVAARATLGGDTQAPSSAAPAGSSGFVPGGMPPAESTGEAPAALETYLPYLTEASFFGLMGFGLGYGAKKMAKLLLIFAAIVFVAVQGLSYAEVLTIDWTKVVELLNTLVLNLKENQTFTEVLTNKLPTAGALIVGFLLGFKRG